MSKNSEKAKMPTENSITSRRNLSGKLDRKRAPSHMSAVHSRMPAERNPQNKRLLFGV
jgi:hypothetical protein